MVFGTHTESTGPEQRKIWLNDGTQRVSLQSTGENCRLSLGLLRFRETRVSLSTLASAVKRHLTEEDSDQKGPTNKIKQRSEKCFQLV